MHGIIGIWEINQGLIRQQVLHTACEQVTLFTKLRLKQQMENAWGKLFCKDVSNFFADPKARQPKVLGNILVVGATCDNGFSFGFW